MAGSALTHSIGCLHSWSDLQIQSVLLERKQTIRGCYRANAIVSGIRAGCNTTRSGIESADGKYRCGPTAQHVIWNKRRTERTGTERISLENIVLSTKSERVVSTKPNRIILEIEDIGLASLSLKGRLGVVDQRYLNKVIRVRDRIVEDRITALPSAPNFVSKRSGRGPSAMKPIKMEYGRPETQKGFVRSNTPFHPVAQAGLYGR